MALQQRQQGHGSQVVAHMAAATAQQGSIALVKQVLTAVGTGHDHRLDVTTMKSQGRPHCPERTIA
jgi:hypothetical protein